MKKWSSTVNATDICIIGGEPFANRDLHKWVDGMLEHFPNVQDKKLTTNGTMLGKNIENCVDWISRGLILEVTVHDPAHKSDILHNIAKIANHFDYKKSGRIVQFFKRLFNYQGNYPDYYNSYNEIYFVNNAPAILVQYTYGWQHWGVNDKFEFYDSDPHAAHETCIFSNCHHVYNGKLYKCPFILGAQTFVEKYPVPEYQKKLVQDYQPIDPDDAQGIANLHRTIPQCSLCPVRCDDPRQEVKLYPMRKKKIAVDSVDITV